MLIIGHRGAAGLEPENTIRSFQKAQELGVDMIETDLRQTADGIIVLHHDPLPKKHKGTHFTTLDELLAVAQVPMNLEIKKSGFEAKLVKRIHNFSDRVLISSFYPGILKKIRALDEKVKLGLIIGKGELHLLPIIERLTNKLKFYSIHPQNSIVSKASMKSFKPLKHKIYVWTVNDKKEFLRLKKLNVDGIFTDRPDIIHK
jgi:glycerophosphoryl diester phosphodiesterase